MVHGVDSAVFRTSGWRLGQEEASAPCGTRTACSTRCYSGFGDFHQGYIIVDKAGVRFLRDPYSLKPHVLFYAYRRVGGRVQNGEAIKLVRFAAAG